MSPAREQGARLRGQELLAVSVHGPGPGRQAWRGGERGALRTGQAVAKLRVGLKVLAMRDHGGAQVAARQLLLLVGALCALRDGLDVDGHGPLHLVHACALSAIGGCPWYRCCTAAAGGWRLAAEYIPSWRSSISISSARNSSDAPVRASAPIFSPAHCLKRPNFLLTFMVAIGFVSTPGGRGVAD